MPKQQLVMIACLATRLCSTFSARTLKTFAETVIDRRAEDFQPGTELARGVLDKNGNHWPASDLAARQISQARESMEQQRENRDPRFGGMGQRAQQWFAEYGIHVVVGAASEPPSALVEAYLDGSLGAGQNPCDH